MSVGRQVCKGNIDHAQDLRYYAELLWQFPNEIGTLAFDCRDLAERLEAIVPAILNFEGEHPKMLTAGG